MGARVSVPPPPALSPWGRGLLETPRPRRGRGQGEGSLVLVEERRRTRDSRSLAVRAVVHARRDVAHVVLDDAHAHGRRALADHADDEDLFGRELPDLLAELDALL